MRTLQGASCACIILAGCVAPGPSPEEGAAAPRAVVAARSAESQQIATLEGGSIEVAAAWRWLLAHEPAAAESAYRGAVLEELARREQAAFGIALSAADGVRVRERVQQRLCEEAELERGAGADVERWCSERHQRSFAVLVGILERDAAVELVLQRAIRLRSLLSAQLDLSLLITASAAKAEEFMSKLRAGAEFAALAREASEHESGSRGGRLPLLPVELLSPAARAGVEALSVGQFTTVLPTRDGRFQILMLHGRMAASFQDAGAALAEVLASESASTLDGPAWRRGLIFLEELYKLRRTANLAPLP